MRNLAEAVRRHIEDWERERGHPLWTTEDVLIVGVSGGPDSIALLHLLAVGGLHSDEQIIVGHVNHLLRESSTSEAQIVASRCESWGLRYRIATIDVAGLAQRERQSVEEAARAARYQFLGDLALEYGSQHVVVGHTADDQVETVLMHFLRGTGLAGLGGMSPAGSLPGFSSIQLLRPLLATRRAETEAYCAAHDLQPIRDPSNDDLSFLRNRLRHELLPLLEAYNPQIRERLLHTSEVVRTDHDYLQSETDDALKHTVTDAGPHSLRLDLGRWRALPLSLRRRTLRQAVWRLCRSARDVSFAPIEQARMVAESGHVGARSTLPGNLELLVEYDALLIHDAQHEHPIVGPQMDPDVVNLLSVPGQVALENRWQVRAVFEKNMGVDAARWQNEPWLEYVDADKVGTLMLRTRRAGDRIRRLGMHGKSTKVAELMINEKIPAHLRGGWPMVVNEHHPVWVLGLGIDERVRINENTRRVIQLTALRSD